MSIYLPPLPGHWRIASLFVAGAIHFYLEARQIPKISNHIFRRLRC
jgi:hypothetical protein